MSLLAQFLSGSHLKVIAAMLFHSLWQGILLAIAAAAVLLMTKRSSAVVRYNLLVALLFIFSAGVIYTYLNYLPQAEIDITEAVYNIPFQEQHNVNPVLSSGGLFTGVINFFHSNASVIVFAWMLVLFIRLCLLFTGYYKVHRFLRKEVAAPSQEWQRRWMSLKSRMNIQHHVDFMESALAKVPMVIGHFRPLVLVPVGMLMSLPPEEAEAILLHELAHIKRRDYLLNLVQQAVESIFFFHPAVRWVCSLISEERENCCDDIASSHNRDKRIYINALVSFYERTLPPAVALSFAGRKYSMMHRIKRLINQRNKTLNIMEKIFLTTALVIAGFLVQAYYHNGTNLKHGIISKQVISDTVPSAQKEAEKVKVDAERAKRDALEAIEDAKKEIERAEKDLKSSRRSENNRNNHENEINIDEREINRVVSEALRAAEKELQTLQIDIKATGINKEVREALKEAQLELRAEQDKLRSARKENEHHQEEMADIHDESAFAALSEQAVQLALKAAQLGLQEANAELKVTLDEHRNEKMDRKEYKERKKQLREEYKNSQRANQ